MRRPSSAARELRQRRLGRRGRRDRIVGIGALHRVIGEREIGARARERPEMIEAATNGKLPARVSRPIGRLQAETGRRSEDGTRIEPLVSEPSASGTRPAATAPPDPPDEPPVMRVSACGLRDGPSCTFSPVKS